MKKFHFHFLFFLFAFAAALFAQTTYQGRAVSIKKNAVPFAFKAKLKLSDSTTQIFYIERTGDKTQKAMNNLFRKVKKDGFGNILRVVVDSSGFAESILIWAKTYFPPATITGVQESYSYNDSASFIKPGWRTQIFVTMADTIPGLVRLYPHGKTSDMSAYQKHLDCDDKNSSGWEGVQAVMNADYYYYASMDWIYFDVSEVFSDPLNGVPLTMIANYSDKNVETD